MSEQELQSILNYVQKGGKLMIGSDPSGRRKIKLVRGPFGLFTKRIECTEQDLERLRHRLTIQ